MKSSIFKNFNEVTENKDILKILDDIKNGVYKPAITYLRNLLQITKRKLPKEPKNHFLHLPLLPHSKEVEKWNF